MQTCVPNSSPTVVCLCLPETPTSQTETIHIVPNASEPKE